MSVQTLYFYGTPGQYSITDSRLTNVEVLCITRSGFVYKDGSPVQGLTCAYQNAFGRILFENPFGGPLGGGRIDRNTLERVSVKYKT